MAASDMRHAQRRPPSTWQSLPSAVLGRCLLAASGEEDRRAAFSTCSSFTKAMLHTASETWLTVHADSFQPALASVLRWAVECEAKLTIIIKRKMQSPPAVTLKHLLRSLKQNGVYLPTVRKVECEGLLMDAHPPDGLSDVFSNLEQLTLTDCLVDTTKLPLLPLTGCSKLQRVVMCDRYPPAISPSEQEAWRLQLLQVANLPSLTALSLNIPSYPSSALPVWAGQLTELQLHYCPHGHAAAHRAWQLAVSHTAQCTSLRVLQLTTCITQDVCTLMASLPQLQDLTLGHMFTTQHPPIAATSKGDVLVSALLQAPHLTRLSASHLPEPVQSYADSPCTWQQLSLEYASPLLLSKLPLHSLTQPLQLGGLEMQGSTVAQVHAAVGNLARSQAPNVVTVPPSDPGDRCNHFEITFIMGDEEESWSEADFSLAASPAELLRAAGPLLPPDATYVSLIDCRVDAAVVTALQQVAPPTLTSLHVGSGDNSFIMVPNAWPQLARSFPQLEELSAHDDGVSPVDVMSYFLAASLLQRGTTVQGVPKAAHITLYVERRDIGSWQHMVEQLDALGFENAVELHVNNY